MYCDESTTVWKETMTRLAMALVILELVVSFSYDIGYKNGRKKEEKIQKELRAAELEWVMKTLDEKYSKP